MFVYIIHLRLYECSPRFILQLHAANEEQEKCHLLVFYILDLIFFFLKCIRISAPVLQQIGLLVEAGLQWWRVQTQFSAICKNVLKGTVWIKSWKASPSLTSSLQVPWELAFALWNSERSLLKTGEAEKKTSRQPAKMDCYKKTVPNQMGALCSGWRCEESSCFWPELTFFWQYQEHFTQVDTALTILFPGGQSRFRHICGVVQMAPELSWF